MGVSIIANTWVHFTEKFRRLFLHTHLNSHCEAQLLISVCSKWEDSLVKGSTQAASDDMTEHTPSMSDHHGLTRPRTESGISLTLWWEASCQLSQPYFQAPSCSKIKDKNVPQHWHGLFLLLCQARTELRSCRVYRSFMLTAVPSTALPVFHWTPTAKICPPASLNLKHSKMSLLKV